VMRCRTTRQVSSRSCWPTAPDTRGADSTTN
jgi:hypothetical protein